MVRPAKRSRRAHGPVRKIVLPLAVSLLLFAVSGCGLLGGSSGGAESGNGKVEQSTITVGTMPAIDVAPLHWAIQQGYFKQAGLNVELRTIPGGAAGIPKLASGDLDITFGNWVSFFRAQSKGMDLKLISDGYQGTEGMFLLMTMPGNGITKPGKLKNEKIAVNTRKNINELTALAALKPYGITEQDVEFVEMGFPDMPAALQRGDVAAASVIEPFISEANKMGAVTLLDTIAGPTANMPVAGYASTKKFAENNPKTAAAFQRVMSRAQAEVGADRNKVENLLPRYAKISPETASLVRLGVFPTTLEASRLKSVVNLMVANGQIGKDFKVEPMIFQAPPPNAK